MKNDKIDIEEEENYVEAIGKIFNKIPIRDRFKNVDNIDLCVLDPPNIAMIKSKSDDGKAIVNMFIDQELGSSKQVNVDYSNKSGRQEYSTHYLIKVLNIFKSVKGIKITSGHDVPITIENEHFKIIIAPRTVGD